MDTQERTIDHIRKAQAGLGVQLKFSMQNRIKPQMLLLGCVDARLNPRDDIGIPDGAAMIRRTISAFVPAYDANDPTAVQFNKLLTEALEGGVQDIAVMGHTYCGGLDGCLCDKHSTLPLVAKYLEPIFNIRDRVKKEIRDEKEQFVAMEDRSVAQIVANIMTYPAVKSLPKEKIHGWVIHTGTRRIREMDPNHPEKPFVDMPILDKKPHDDNVIELVRYKQGEVVKERRFKPKHEPEMLIIGDTDAEINPSNDLNIPYGKALIYRDRFNDGEEILPSKQAALQFAIQAMKVKDVVVLGHYDSRKGEDDLTVTQQQLRERYDRLAKSPIVQDAVRNHGVKLHGWVFDNAMHPPRIFEMDGQQVFKPMAHPECKSPPLR